MTFSRAAVVKDLEGKISSFAVSPLVERGLRVAVPDYSRAPGGEEGCLQTMHPFYFVFFQ